MEFGSIEREIHIDASPEVVYEVISSPQHLQQWFPDEAELDPTPGAVGEFCWGDRSSSEAHIAPIVVVHADPPRRFAFRWCHAENDVESAKSLLATFELVPAGAGTLLRLTETGFREMGWEAAVLEAEYNDHSAGWDLHLGRLGAYVPRMVSTP